MKIACIVGIRPNFVKIAPIINEFKKKGISYKLIHTGQHYDIKMSESFFDELGIPKPDVNLELGSASPKIGGYGDFLPFIPSLVNEIREYNPDYVLVVGDGNTTLFGAVGAKTAGCKLIHVEAGLRSGNMKMAEEFNRIWVDRMSDVLFLTEEVDKKNVKDKKNVFFAGNVMIDTLLKNMTKIDSRDVLKKYKLKEKEYAVLTIHRAETTDDKQVLKNILETVSEINKKIKLVWPIHPRTSLRIKEFGFENFIKGIEIVPPMDYLNFIKLNKESRFVITDSGGIQEETTILGVPCLTIREETERPVTVEVGTNTIVGLNKSKIMENVNLILSGKYKKGKIPKYWDGKAAERVVKNILEMGK